MARLQAGQGHGQRAPPTTHSLYVKRHQGVRYKGWAEGSGVWETPAPLMPLPCPVCCMLISWASRDFLASESVPSKELLMLNELFGKFDQIAKVRGGFLPTFKLPTLERPCQEVLPYTSLSHFQAHGGSQILHCRTETFSNIPRYGTARTPQT